VGRLGFRRYTKGKKAKYVIQFYELCSPDGYILNIEVYKEKQFLNVALTYKNVQLSTKGLWRLIKIKVNNHLLKENYYNSLNLLNYLLKHKIHTTGIL